MERIDKKYAIIYIDREGETLKEGVSDFTTNEIINDYYNNPGFLQWNYYLIIPKELVDSEKTKEIESNEIYTRKVVVGSEKISEYLETLFPEIKEGQQLGEMILVKGEDYSNSVKLAETIKDQKCKEHQYYEVCPGHYRNYSSIKTLTIMDTMRAKLIKHPNTKQIYYTHISAEYSWAQKKFKLFINEKSEIEVQKV